MNGVQEEIRHVLDSEIAENGGNLTPQQMYEAVKRYETYVAHNKRLKGKGASPSASQPKAAGHASGYKLQFHKTMAFAATIPESEDDGPGRHESSSQEGANPLGAESSQEDDEELFIPSYLEEALPNDPVLQMKMARAMQAQEVETWRCFTCNQQGHQRDHWKYEEKNGSWPLVKDQTTRTATETLKNGYFRLFGAPAYLVSDQGKAFTGHVITHLCELYGVQKLRTSPYHAQTNGQVECMNQTIIRMISKLEEDRKACSSKHLPELLLAYNVTCSTVMGYSPYYLLFGRRPRIPVDYLFPTLRDSPHQTKMKVSVAAMQKRLDEAFTVARCLTSEEVARQCRYYDRKAGAVALQPGDIVMVRTDGFVGKRKVKN